VLTRLFFVHHEPFGAIVGGEGRRSRCQTGKELRPLFLFRVPLYFPCAAKGEKQGNASAAPFGPDTFDLSQAISELAFQGFGEAS